MKRNFDITPSPGRSDFDEVSFIMEYEAGELSEDEMVEGFQRLVDSGTVWQLQGHYGRTAAALIEAGLVTAPGRF